LADWLQKDFTNNGKPKFFHALADHAEYTRMVSYDTLAWLFMRLSR
jgi:hypothetical protein